MFGRQRLLPLAAFTAVFAVFAAYVFWGTWSPDFAPVMPDHPTTHSPFWLSEWIYGWPKAGLFIPGDLVTLLGGPYAVLEFKYVLSLYCAALGLAYFCRGRGLSPLASYGAGLLLAFSGYWMTLFSAGHYGWFQWMAYGVFAFALTDRAIAGNRLPHWLLLGACTAWGSFAQPDMWLLFTAFTGVYFICRLVRARVFPWKGILIAGAAFALIGAPSVRNAFASSLAGRKRQIAEGQTVAGAADRKSGAEGSKMDDAEKQWIFATNWSLPAEESAEFFVRRLNGDTSCPLTLSLGRQAGRDVKPYTGALGRPKDAPQGNYRQHSLYVGVVTCLLALCGVVLGGRRCLFFVIATVVFWLFSLGRNCEPVYRLVYALPFGSYLRAPVKWHHLTELCLAVLAAYGIDALLNSRLFASEALRRGRRGFWILAGAVVLGVADLAAVAHLYCAPVNVGPARRSGSTMQMTILPRQQFQNPQVAAMVKAGRIVSLANYLGNPDYFVVGILDKCRPPQPPKADETDGFVLALGIVSLLSTLAVAIVTFVPWLAGLRGRI